METVNNMNWIELSNLFQKFVVIKLIKSFNKNSNDEIIYNIINRFNKKSCKINLYYINLDLKGIYIYWSINKFIYLDKFFTLKQKNGYGAKMLDYFINSHKIESIRNNINKGLLWRTDHLTSKFYLKHSNVIKYFELGYKNGEQKIYLGTRNKINSWEYEDIYDINITSCFT